MEAFNVGDVQSGEDSGADVGIDDSLGNLHSVTLSGVWDFPFPFVIILYHGIWVLSSKVFVKFGVHCLFFADGIVKSICFTPLARAVATTSPIKTLGSVVGMAVFFTCGDCFIQHFLSLLTYIV